MFPPDAACAVAALFIVAMVWLRTRMHYARERGRPSARVRRLTLTRAGGCYFAALVAVLVLGWFAAPPLLRPLAGPGPAAATLPRVVWFLLAYYLFIPVHRALAARGVQVFKTPVADIQGSE